jgi:hypothetical protein
MKNLKLNIGDEISLYGYYDDEDDDFIFPAEIENLKSVDFNESSSDDLLITGKIIFKNKDEIFVEFLERYPTDLDNDIEDLLGGYLDIEDIKDNIPNYSGPGKVFTLNISDFEVAAYHKEQAMEHLLNLKKQTEMLKNQIDNKLNEMLQIAKDIKSICNQHDIEISEINSDIRRKNLDIVEELGWSTSSFFC